MNLYVYGIGILYRAIFIITFTTLILFTLPSVSLASEEVTITRTWNGITVPIPVELNKGDRIIADMLITEDSMWVQVISPSGKVIAEGIDIALFHFDYTAENSETISFAISWLFGTGNPEYFLTYTIYPIGSIQPPLIVTTPTPTTTTHSDATDLLPWFSLGGGFVVIILLIALIVVRNRARRKKDYDKVSEDTAVEEKVGDTSLIENFPKECKRCKGTGQIKRGKRPVMRDWEIEMEDIYYTCLTCGGTGWTME